MSEKPMPRDTRIEKFPPLHEVMPCPFCGADREYIVAEEYECGVGKRWRVVCLNCMATMDKEYCQTQWQALEAWNRRAQPENEPIVRCGECIHFEPYDGEEHKGNCNELVGLDSCMYEDNYCSYGERKPERSEG